MPSQQQSRSSMCFEELDAAASLNAGFYIASTFYSAKNSLHHGDPKCGDRTPYGRLVHGVVTFFVETSITRPRTT